MPQLTEQALPSLRTSRATRFASAGLEGVRWPEMSVSSVFVLGLLSSILGTAWLLVGLVRGRSEKRSES